jgi:hypothetical protein
MLRLAFIIGSLLLHGFHIDAQNEYIRTLDCEAQCRLGERDNAFVVTHFSLAEGTAKDAPYLQAVEVINDNMVCRFSLPKMFPNEYYLLEWTVVTSIREFRIAPERMSRHVIQAHEQASVYEVTWYHPFDQVPFRLEEFIVVLQADYYGKPCDFAEGFVPSFNWKKQRGHVGVVLLGGALIGLSEVVYTRQAKDDYAKYRELATTEPLSPSSPEEVRESEKLLAQAKDNQSTADLVRSTGQVIIAGSVLVYTIRYLMYRKDFQKWQRYCDDGSQSLGLRPMFENSAPGQSVGLALTYTF